MNRTEHLLSCLAEECAEVAQRVSKALRFGLDEVQPGQLHDNAERIVMELCDLAAVCQILSNEGVLQKPDERTTALVENKKKKLTRYIEYAEKCGTLERASSSTTTRKP